MRWLRVLAALAMASFILHAQAFATGPGNRPKIFYHIGSYTQAPCAASYSQSDSLKALAPCYIPSPSTEYDSFIGAPGTPPVGSVQISPIIDGIKITVPWSIVAQEVSGLNLTWTDVIARIKYWLDRRPGIKIGLSFSAADESVGVNGLSGSTPSTPAYILSASKSVSVLYAAGTPIPNGVFPIIRCDAPDANGKLQPLAPAPVYFTSIYFNAWTNFAQRTINFFSQPVPTLPADFRLTYLRFGIGQGDESGIQGSASGAVDSVNLINGKETKPCEDTWVAWDKAAHAGSGQTLGGKVLPSAPDPAVYSKPDQDGVFTDYSYYAQQFLASVASARANAVNTYAPQYGNNTVPLILSPFNDTTWDKYTVKVGQAVSQLDPHPFSAPLESTTASYGFIGGNEGFGSSIEGPGNASEPVAISPCPAEGSNFASIYNWSEKLLTPRSRPSMTNFYAQSQAPGKQKQVHTDWYNYFPGEAYNANFYDLAYFELYEDELFAAYEDCQLNIAGHSCSNSQGMPDQYRQTVSANIQAGLDGTLTSCP